MSKVDANVSLETADCLVRKSAIGNDVVTNICTGSVQHVPWQAGDWINSIAATLLALVFVAMLGVVAVVLWQMVRDDF